MPWRYFVPLRTIASRLRQRKKPGDPLVPKCNRLPRCGRDERSIASRRQRRLSQPRRFVLVLVRAPSAAAFGKKTSRIILEAENKGEFRWPRAKARWSGEIQIRLCSRRNNPK